MSVIQEDRVHTIQLVNDTHACKTHMIKRLWSKGDQCNHIDKTFILML